MLITYYQIVLSIYVLCIFDVSVVSCMCVSDIDTGLFHFQLSIDKYWMCGRNVYMCVSVCVCVCVCDPKNQNHICKIM